MFFVFMCCVIGFAAWAFLQKGYIENDQSRILIFPILVPLISSLFVLGYFHFVKNGGDTSSSLMILKNGLNARLEILLIILSSVGLAIGYVIYPILINKNPLYATYYLIATTIFVSALFIIFKWNNGAIIFNRLPRWYEVLGILISLFGIILMKFGNHLKI